MTVVNWNINQACPIVENMFSNLEMNYRVWFYQQQIERIEKEGDDAFLKTQLEWLGLNESDTQKVVISGSEEEKSKLRDSIQEVLDEYVGKSLDKNENLELKARVKTDLINLLNHYQKHDTKKMVDSLKKNDRPISTGNFNDIMKTIDLKYKMTSKRNPQRYCIRKVED